MPFIHVEDIGNSPHSFVHELQHGIEEVNHYKMNIYFCELGPILLETLYIDEMVKNNEKDASLLYLERILVIENYLDRLYSYFKCLKLLKNKNFYVTNNDFIDIIRSTDLIYKDENILQLKTCLNEEYRNFLMYVLSFLRSLEIRNKTYDDKKIGFKMLKKDLNSKYIGKINTKLLLEIYENYLCEVCNKKVDSSYTKKYSK